MMDPNTAALVALASQLPIAGQYVASVMTIGAFLCAIASVVATKLPGPASTTGTYYWVYTIVNLLALARGHAVSLSAPASEGIVGGAGAVEAPLVALTATPLASLTPQTPAALMTTIPSLVVVPLPVPSIPPVPPTAPVK
jgi:hypothetical protein